ncbi:hypothetical protein C8R48DRAFT_673846 [Suillus tomentosus]|nr:hypothetical protein C8R48DRAFT_673846 [Suillus tomentosus]
MNPDTYGNILPGANAMMHTIGTLLDNTQCNEQFHDKDFRSLTVNTAKELRMFARSSTFLRRTTGLLYRCDMVSKLEAERKIDEIMKDHPQYQVFGLARLMTIPPNLFTFSAWVHACMQYFVPMLASIVGWLGTRALSKVTEQTPALPSCGACRPFSSTTWGSYLRFAGSCYNVRGSLGVRAMREPIGWSKGGPSYSVGFLIC